MRGEIRRLLLRGGVIHVASRRDEDMATATPFLRFELVFHLLVVIAQRFLAHFDCARRIIARELDVLEIDLLGEQELGLVLLVPRLDLLVGDRDLIEEVVCRNQRVLDLSLLLLERKATVELVGNDERRIDNAGLELTNQRLGA